MKRFAVIVAGGKGLRMGSDIPKQFLILNGMPVLMHTIQKFSQINLEKIILVLPESQFDYWDELKKQYNFTLPHELVKGGETRFHSVKNGLDHIQDSHSLVAIHDGVRPMIQQDFIEQSFIQAEKFGNSILAIKPKDSIRKQELLSNHSVNRNNYYLIQTPQTFQTALIKEAYEKAEDDNFTDDASVLEGVLKQKIHLIQGDENNIKITSPVDLKIASVLL
ncbi:MAG: 2-C-methyl-D-erythritol 4-phosphate cytidylyltransferase [Bacteroidia bacterium]